MIKVQKIKSFEIHVYYATYYLGKLTNLNFDFFFAKNVMKTKNGYIFCIRCRKKSITYQNDCLGKEIQILTPRVVWDFFRFSKFQREIWKQEDFRFCQKKWKNWFFLNFFCCFLLFFNYFELFGMFWIFWIFLVFEIFRFFLNFWGFFDFFETFKFSN